MHLEQIDNIFIQSSGFLDPVKVAKRIGVDAERHGMDIETELDRVDDLPALKTRSLGAQEIEKAQ